MDRKLREHLMEESGYSQELKDSIWEEIEARLDEEEEPREAGHELNNSEHQGGADMNMRTMETSRQGRIGKKKRHTGWKITAGAAAAAVALTAFLTMPAGTAMMKSVEQWFAPQKKIDISIEGQQEETQGKLHQDEASHYVIYYDKERYKLVEGQDKDVITTIEPLPERYPAVSLTIEQNTGEKPEALAGEIAESLKGEYTDVREIEQVEEPVKGYRIHAIDGQEWNSKVITVYVTSNEREGSFVLTENYFLEAAEGHGARFRQMLEQFEILPGEEK
ncbi:hypothetical protein [Paenibacillus sp. HB172176]|uniref:hypothetical protein n=1 Tax=Paenibacillus sp. HB172176 TaxID=2493690 RepID=UPI00143C21C2|nr:hypothetical protein [Paenibacillus sp. HB172176]